MTAYPINSTVAGDPIASLLLACGRAQLRESELDNVRKCVELNGFDFETAIQTAASHGVVPLLHRALERACPATIPAEIRAKLQRRSQENAMRNLRLMQALLKLLGAMRAQNIRVLPYKGPLLALLAYGDPSLRQCGDLDILVPEPEIPAARNILTDLGYLPSKEMSQEEEAKYVASPHEYDFAYLNADKSVMVELHWQVAGRFLSFDPDPTDLWRRSSAQTIFGTSVNMLAVEDLLLILCAHGTKHFWSRLTWICDIALLVQKYPALDWDLLLRRADELGARGMTLLSLELANQVLGIPLPSQVWRAIKPSIADQAHLLAERLFQPASEDPLPKGARMQLTGGGLMESLLFHMRTRESWASGLRYVFHRALVPNAVDQGWLNLPRPLGFLYYLLRPLRLLGKYGPVPVSKDWRKDKSAA